MRIVSFILLPAVFLYCIPLPGQTTAEKIDTLMNYCHKNGIFNGSILVAEEGDIIYKKGFGYANFEWKTPNEPDTKFRIGEVTGVFTNILALQFVVKDSLRLDAKITEYLDNLPGESTDKITIRHLITNSSGIICYTSIPEFAEWKTFEQTPEKFCRIPLAYDLLFQPGTYFKNSSSNSYLLGVILEKVTGEPFEELLRKNILEPAGMKNSGYDNYSVVMEKRAAGYERSPMTYKNAEREDMTVSFSAAGIYSTVEDLCLWDHALYEDTLLSAPLIKLMTISCRFYNEPATESKQTPPANDTDFVHCIEYNGKVNGFHTCVLKLPEERRTIILINNTGTTNFEEIANAIAGILSGNPYKLPKIPVSLPVLAEMEQSGIKKAVRKYHDLKKDSSNFYSFGESVLNSLGKDLLERSRDREALAVFGLNTEQYPESSSAFASLGEAYVKLGQHEEAIRQFRKSLELYPGNVQSIRLLKELMYNSNALKINIRVSPVFLEEYAGEYELAEDYTLKITKTGERLYARMTGYQPCELSAFSETHFYSRDFIYKGEYAEISFTKNILGKVTGLTLKQNQGTFNAQKINGEE